MNAFVRVVSAIFIIIISSIAGFFLSLILLGLPVFINNHSWILASISFCTWVIVVHLVIENLIPEDPH